MKRTIKLLLLVTLVGCGKKKTDAKTVVFGATAGPYTEMAKQAIAPLLEKQGYKFELKEFTDYVQPNLALAQGALDANLFQHNTYLQKFASEKKLALSPLITVPTVPNGIYSKKVKELKKLPAGATVAIANDATNLARHLGILQKLGLLMLKGEVEPLKASEKDIASTKNGLKVKPIDAAQLPRSLDSAEIAIVTGNFALTSGLKLTDALYLEELPERYVNLIAVRTEDLESEKIKALKNAVESAEYAAVIGEKFKGYFRPDWFVKKFGRDQQQP